MLGQKFCAGTISVQKLLTVYYRLFFLKFSLEQCITFVSNRIHLKVKGINYMEKSDPSLRSMASDSNSIKFMPFVHQYFEIQRLQYRCLDTEKLCTLSAIPISF